MNAEKFFKTRNLYEILNVSPDAEIQEGEHCVIHFIRNQGVFVPNSNQST